MAGKVIAAALPLLLAACSSFNSARDEYHEGMSELRHYPDHARTHFAVAADLLAETLPDLDYPRVVTGASIRLRSLVELERIDEADAMLAAPIEGFDPSARYEGDKVGLAMLRARALDPERGFAELLLAARRTGSARARLHLVREQVLLLSRLGTEKAIAQARKLCEANKGRLDFDALKDQLN